MFVAQNFLFRFESFTTKKRPSHINSPRRRNLFLSVTPTYRSRDRVLQSRYSSSKLSRDRTCSVLIETSCRELLRVSLHAAMDRKLRPLSVSLPGTQREDWEQTRVVSYFNCSGSIVLSSLNHCIDFIHVEKQIVTIILPPQRILTPTNVTSNKVVKQVQNVLEIYHKMSKNMELDDIVNGPLFGWIDYLLFCLMLSSSAMIGIYFGFCGKKEDTPKEYLHGGKTMRTFPVAVSLVTSSISGITMLGLATEVYIHGTLLWLDCFSAMIAGLLITYFYLPVFYELQSISSYEYLDLRFNRSVRIMTERAECAFYYSFDLCCLHHLHLGGECIIFIIQNVNKIK
ncbi:hypothetical protein C0J52_02934 [Blattella germanica]|nr:hypothetical protein C0J52_02934 [Blattella germanica]